MQSLVKRPNICFTYFKEKLLVSNTCCIFRKTSKIYTIGMLSVAFDPSLMPLGVGEGKTKINAQLLSAIHSTSLVGFGV